MTNIDLEIGSQYLAPKHLELLRPLLCALGFEKFDAAVSFLAMPEHHALFLHISFENARLLPTTNGPVSPNGNPITGEKAKAEQ